MKKKTCNRCGTLKDLDEFSRDKTRKDGYQTICKACIRERTQENTISIENNGYIRTIEQRRRMSSSHRGQIPWNKGTGGCKNGHDPSLYVCLPSGVFVCLGCKRINGKKYRAGNREKLSIKNRVARYNMSLEELDELWSKQNGRCAICNGTLDTKKYCIDHDHSSGKVRGLLCSSCNTAIGLLKDSPEIICNAMRYLKNERK